MTPGGLALENVSLTLRGSLGAERTVLTGVTAAFPAGELSLVSGPTGSGKSSLLSLLAGLRRPTAGVVLASGRPVSRWVGRHRDLYRREVGIAFQEPRLLPGLTVLENVLLPLVPRSVGLAAARHAALERLAALSLLELAGRDPGTLSGGERQRAALARALVATPLYLLLDEPSSHQDAPGLDLVAAAMEEARARGAAVVATSHDPRLLERGGTPRRLALAEGALVPVA